MKIRILSGRAGSGKSRKAIEEITEYLGRKERGRCFLIVPEQYMINAERSLLETEGCKGLMGDEVTGFKRLAYLAFKEVGISCKPGADVITCMLFLVKALEYVHEELEYYGEMWANTQFIDSLFKQIEEFEHYMVTPDVLEALAEKEETKKKTGLREKLRDIAKIFREYKNLLNDNYSDSADEAQRFIELLRERDIFRGAHIWIDEFHGFTGEEYCIIEELAKQAEEITVCLCKDGKSKEGSGVFEASRKTFVKLGRIAARTGAAFEETVCGENKRNGDDMMLSFAEKNFFRYPYGKTDVPEDGGSIHIRACRSPFDEVSYCAGKIRNDVAEGKMKYSDVSVIISDSETYERIVDTVFTRAGIPFFLDRKKDPSDHPYARYIKLLLDAVSEGMQTETVFDLIRTGLYTDDTESADYLELYFKKTDLTGKAAWKRKIKEKIFGMMKQNDGGKAYEAAEELRKTVCEDVENFENKLSPCRTVADICAALADFLEEKKIVDRLEKKDDDLLTKAGAERSAEFARGIQAVNDTITKIYSVLGTLPAYCGEDDKERAGNNAGLLGDYYKTVITHKMVGYLPVTYDSVQIGTKERSRSHETECLYLIGANDGLLPKQPAGSGIISDPERVFLNENDIDTADDDRAMAISEQFRIYKTITLPKKELNISYSLGSRDNKKTDPSAVVERMKELFNGLREESDENEEKAEEGYCGIREMPSFETDEARNLYMSGGRISSSFTQIEGYTKCAFRYYLSDVLGIVSEDEFIVTSLDYGSAIHEVLHKALEKAAKEKDGAALKNMTEEECRKYVDEFADDICTDAFGKTTDKSELSARLNYFIERLKQSAAKTMKKSLKYGVPVGFELNFGKGDSDPLTFEIPLGEENISVDIRGKIDRIDFESGPDGDSVTVVDYKAKYAKEDKSAHIKQLSVYMEKAIEKYTEDVKNNKGGLSGSLKEKEALKVANVFYDSGSSQPTSEAFFDPEAMSKYKDEDVTRFAAGLYEKSFASTEDRNSISSCGNCDYAGICRTMRKMQKKRQSKS